ncbi:ATP-binding cassette domain-containing protein [Namhaeicola litoreus]|uniref:ATP-binding cassette domain-containing protein n=1 Tax=Namhaeicola litoreus TaxID=1052145 RepID=A0ABW3Y210_9FLAO
MIELSINKELHAANGHFDLQVELRIEKGNFVSIYGKSGAGKTSLLKVLAGLMPPDSGEINVKNQIWFDAKKKIHLEPQKRNIGFVFQDYALFPNMTVKENLVYASRYGNLSMIEELIEVSDLGELAHRKPEFLSGGQKQRVAVARALAQKPEILILDEPLSALDQEMRQELQDYILLLHKKFDLTTIMISHDIGEIVKMSDVLIVLEKGRIKEMGNPKSLLFKSNVSGKFQLTGKVLNIEKQDFLTIFTVLTGQEIVKVVGEEADSARFKIGDTVLLAAMAFSPLMYSRNQ